MPMNKIRKIWRTHKDRLFHRLFSEKENALSLYNALNGTNYGMEDGLKIVTLEDAIYVKNTVFTVYFGKDEIGTNTEKPKTPDGIPDMYQVVFRYISENPSYGTVDGVAVVDGYVMEVVTRITTMAAVTVVPVAEAAQVAEAVPAAMARSKLLPEVLVNRP